VLILGSTTMHQSATWLRLRSSRGAGAQPRAGRFQARCARCSVDLGLAQSKSTYFAPRPAKDDLLRPGGPVRFP
jgi:hypothetical protein